MRKEDSFVKLEKTGFTKGEQMDTNTYASLDAVALAALIKKKEISFSEVMAAAHKRLEETNPALNAVIHTRREIAAKEAEHISKELPLAGVPMVMKNISQGIKGDLLTAGSRLLTHNRAKQDSNLVAKLRRMGILFLGHTNTPEFGLKNVTEPELYGPTRNPWNSAYSAGGSSGGSAASIAAGIVPVAGASDGGGSIRIPASFTGLFGLKPTRGRTPVGPGTGRQWQGASIDFALSKSVRDTAVLLDGLQTVQPEAAFQTPLFKGSYIKEVQAPKKRRLRIAYTTESPVHTPVSEEAVAAVSKTVKWLEEQGHAAEEKNIPVHGPDLMRQYYIMNSGEVAAVMAGMEEAMGRTVKREDMELITWVLYQAGLNITAAEYSRSLSAWDAAAAQMAVFHMDWDLFLTPTTAFPAPEVGELAHSSKEEEALLSIGELNKAEQQQLVWDMFEPSLTYTPFTQLANLTGQPAMSVPVHVTRSGLPVGVQFLAPKGKEDWLLTLAAQIEESDLWSGQKQNPALRR